VDNSVEYDLNLVRFVARPPTSGDRGAGFTPHRDSGDLITARLEDLQEDWKRVLVQIRSMLVTT
jgi:hypothetical protein